MHEEQVNRIGVYDILGLVGQGGTSAVYRARHRFMNRIVALKVLNAPGVKDEYSIKRFRLEMEVAGMLSHPNILRAYDAGCEDGRHYLAMELCSGADLNRMVRDQGRLSIDDSVDFVCQSATGLAHAHERGIVHRDVKPSNLFLKTDGGCLVFDWGLARLHDATPKSRSGEGRKADSPSPRTPPPRPIPEFREPKGEDQKPLTNPGFETLIQTIPYGARASEAVRTGDDVESAANVVCDSLSWEGHLVGTVAFMSPEQAQGRPIDRRSDIYNLGATFFYLLTGRVMHEGSGVTEMLLKLVNAAPPSLVEVREDLSPGLDGVFQRMVAKDREERYQSMAEVIRDLNREHGKSKIFISYRRGDSLDATDRMYEQLRNRFGADGVFMDVDTIPPGSDFRQRLNEAVAESSVVLAVIGDHWLETGEKRLFRRKRRLFDPNDFVRIEIEAAFQRAIPIIPVLVGQAHMPSTAQLPDSIRELAFQQAAELRAGREYHQHLKTLIGTIEAYLLPKHPPDTGDGAAV